MELEPTANMGGNESFSNSIDLSAFKVAIDHIKAQLVAVDSQSSQSGKGVLLSTDYAWQANVSAKDNVVEEFSQQQTPALTQPTKIILWKVSWKVDDQQMTPFYVTGWQQ